MQNVLFALGQMCCLVQHDQSVGFVSKTLFLDTFLLKIYETDLFRKQNQYRPHVSNLIFLTTYLLFIGTVKMLEKYVGSICLLIVFFRQQEHQHLGTWQANLFSNRHRFSMTVQFCVYILYILYINLFF